jgi:type IV pilus assembly protein PilA
VRHAARPVLIFAVLVLLACNPTASVKHSGRETSPIKEITTIHSAQVQYYYSYNRFASSLQELGSPPGGAEGPTAAGLIDRDLASGEKDGFKYAIQATPKGYNVTAVPTRYATGSKTFSFFSDQGMGIHQHVGQEPATVNDPLIGH